MKYRREIDGLRAIAVLPVIFYHAGFTGFSGGFIGVDVFFVISGYLITSIILEEIKYDKFSIRNFYERRARRILPLVGMVLLLTTIFAYIFMSPADLASYSHSLISVSLFSSNIFFYYESGYFSSLNEQIPLLHTWSLAVEEQFYLVFPFLLIISRTRLKFILIPLLIFISLISIAYMKHLLSLNEIDKNFYLIFSRGWELLFGSLISIFYQKNKMFSNDFRNVISLVSFITLLLSFSLIDKYTLYPSLATLLPVCSTCFLIFFLTKESTITRVLSNKLISFIGLISYSLYLWHQPVFAYLRITSLYKPSFITLLIAIIVTFILSTLSWKYIETPFRNKNQFSKEMIFKYSFLLIITFVFFGIIGFKNEGFPKRFSNKNYSDSIKFSPKRSQCHSGSYNYIDPKNACHYFSGNTTWATLGDSHIVELAYALAKALEKKHEGIIQYSYSGCPPSLLLDLQIPKGCSKWTKEVIQLIVENDNIKNVLINFRYSYHLFGDQLSIYPLLPNINPIYNLSPSFTEKISKDANSIRELYWESFHETILKLIKSNKNIYIVYPIPELPTHINNAIIPFSVFGDKTKLNLKKATTTKYYLSRNKYIINKLNSLEYSSQLHAVKTLDLFCDELYCSAVKNEKSLYADDDHVSLYGASLIVSEILKDRQLLEKF